jgi:hypothetical protein
MEYKSKIQHLSQLCGLPPKFSGPRINQGACTGHPPLLRLQRPPLMSGDDELPPVRGVPTSLRGPRSLESQEKLTGPGPGPSVRPSLEASAALGQPSDGTLTF